MKCCAATAVGLMSFKARGIDAAVELSWETASEINNLGFHLYRSGSEQGPFERITPAVIPGLGNSSRGARYVYTDKNLENGRTYYYQLEDLEIRGRTERHGPIAGTPQRGVLPAVTPIPLPPSPGSSTPGLPAAMTYGNPGATTFRLLERSERGVVLELTTGGFYAQPRADGSVRLSMPGFVEDLRPGAPAIPVWRGWVDALAGRTVRVQSVDVSDVETFATLRPVPGDAPAIVTTAGGVARAARAARDEDEAFFGRALYPKETAVVLNVAFLGDHKKAYLEIAPLRWDPRAAALRLARRVVIRLDFRNIDRRELSEDGSRGRRVPSLDRTRRGGTRARLAVRDAGLYRVSFEEVAGTRGASVPITSLRLSRLGEPVAFHLEPNTRRFGPGSTLYFVSEGAALNPYGPDAVYELEFGRAGVRMAQVSAPPTGPPVLHYWHRVEQERNNMFVALLDTPNLWVWESIFAPATASYAFEVRSLVPRSEPGRLELWFHGVAGGAPSHEHRLRLQVNGVFIGDTEWPANQPQHVEVPLPPAVLHEGTNELSVENVSDPGESYSAVLLDRFTLTYPRQLVAESGLLTGTVTETGTADLAGLVGDSAVLLDLSEGSPRWLVGSHRTGDRVRFAVDAGRRYLAVGSQAILRPEVRLAQRSELKSETNRADWILVAPRAFLPATEALVQLRRAQGLLARTVAFEDVVAEFGFGESRPQALRDFLTYAYHYWRKSPHYVLLVGDGTYDYKDYLGTGVQNHVPPVLVKTTFMWTASDPLYAAVNGDDILPDLALGRLPAASVAEAQTMVDKIVAFETAGLSLNGPVVLVADNADDAGDFQSDAETIAAGLAGSREVQKVYLGELGSELTRQAIVDGFDSGPALVSYLGHGSFHLWAHEDIFNTGTVATLAPQPRQAFVLTFNCLNGYFHFPYFDSLAEALLKAEGKGAIAAFSPSGLSLNEPAQIFHRALLAELTPGRHVRLGDAVLAAQGAYVATGAFPELVSIYHLFGDPAMLVR